MYNAPYAGVADQLAKFGRYGDSELVHLNPIEVQMLASLSPTGRLTTNPMTGRKEAFLPFLAPLLGSFLGKAALGSTLGATAAGALGSAAATTLATGDLEQGIISGITGFGIGSALGGLSDAVKAGTDVATQAATEGVTQAATDAATQSAAQAITPEAINIQPLGTGMGLESQLPTSSLATASMEQFLPMSQQLDALSQGLQAPLTPAAPAAAVTPPPAPTFMESLAQPFQQPGQFIGELAKPGSFLPIYVGETGRMAREQEREGRNTMRAYEEEQEAQRQKTLGQIGGVYDRIRAAYPGVGYFQGGEVDRYQVGGGIENAIRQAAINAGYGGEYGNFSGSLPFNIPDPKDVQLSLRGSQFVPPPASSYSALDVGGEGYLAGMAPEFQYFREPPPPPPPPPPPTGYVPPPPGTVSGGGGGAGPGDGDGGAVNFMGGTQGFDFGNLLSGFRGLQNLYGRPGGGVDTGAGPVAGRGPDMSMYGQQSDMGQQPIADTLAIYRQPPTERVDYSGGFGGEYGDDLPFRTEYAGGSPNYDMGNTPIQELVGIPYMSPIAGGPVQSPTFGGKRLNEFDQFVDDFPTLVAPPEDPFGRTSGPSPPLGARVNPNYGQPGQNYYIFDDDFSPEYAGSDFASQLGYTPTPPMDYRPQPMPMPVAPDRGGLSFADYKPQQTNQNTFANNLLAPDMGSLGGGIGAFRAPVETPYTPPEVYRSPQPVQMEPEPVYQAPVAAPPAMRQPEPVFQAPPVQVPPVREIPPAMRPQPTFESPVAQTPVREPEPVFQPLATAPPQQVMAPPVEEPSFDPQLLERLIALSRSSESLPQEKIGFSETADFVNPFSEFNAMDDGRFAEGGMVNEADNAMGRENSIVDMTVAAIRGEIDNADQIIRRFVEMYGPEVFMQLREQVLQDIVPGAQTEGMIEGEGGGQDDLVEGMIGTQRPVAVSPGEYIIPADVVSLAGGGYSGDGAKYFDDLIEDIRMKTMGKTDQIRPYQRNA